MDTVSSVGAEHGAKITHRAQILVVDDNPATRRFVRETLVLEGYEVVEAEGGRAAIEVCTRHAPDLVLIDLCMGDMRGTDVIQWLQARPPTADVPIVVFTGAPDEVDACGTAGRCSDLLAKPVDSDALVRVVREHLTPATPAHHGRHEGPAPPRALLVDADHTRTMRVRLHLRRLGLDVMVATTASQALRSARAFRPDLVVADLVLPDTTALDLTRSLHGVDLLAAVPVVLTSAGPWSDAQQRLAERAGAGAYVTLTADFAALSDAVLAALPDLVPPHDNGRSEERGRAELAILHGLAEALSDTADLDEVLTEALARCLHAIGASRGAVFVEELGGDFSTRAHLGDLRRLPAAGLPASDELFHRVKAQGETLVVDGSTIIAPLAAGPECFGVLAVEVPTHEDLAYWLHFLKLVGLALGFAVANVRRAPAGRPAAGAGRDGRAPGGRDELTGLASAARFGEVLAATLEDPSARGAVLVLDLDRIRHVNDALGHHTGDELLRGVARCLEDATGPATTVARLHSDAFAILAPEAEGVDGAVALARRVMAALEAPVRCNGYTLYTTASLGVALFPEHARRPAALVQHATTALDQAKERGGATFDVYSEHRGDLLWQRLTVDQGLRAALEHDRFSLHYQPIVELESGEVVAAEALLRWERPFHGLTAAASFIEVAEETGLIVPIGAWVLSSAAHQAAAWARDDHVRRVAVNVGAREFHHGHVYDTVARVLDESGADPRNLSLEITERVALADIDHAVATLGRLRRLGVHTALDDFGTGYSSLRYVQDLPVDTLKIDRAFVANASANPRAEPILAGIVELAHRLEMNVVAEGIETDRCLSLVHSLGCDMAQGYHLGRPVPAPELLGT